MGARNILYWVNAATGVRTLQVFDPEAAPLKRFRGLEFFPVDPAFRVTGDAAVQFQPALFLSVPTQAEPSAGADPRR